MNMYETHPDSEQLDSLRAGLLDDKPSLKADLEAHLDQCASCRKHYTLAGYLSPDKLPVPTPTRQLNQIRQQSLEARAPRQRLLPFAVAAALVLVAVVLVKSSLDTSPDTRIAQTNAETAPVLYEDLDFYLWLADHKENSDSTT